MDNGERIARLEERIDALAVRLDREVATVELRRQETLSNLESRLNGLNDLREQVIADRGQFLTREVYETRHEQLARETQRVKETAVTNPEFDNTIANLTTRLAELERNYATEGGRYTGSAAAQQRLYMAGGVAVAFLSILITVILLLAH